MIITIGPVVHVVCSGGGVCNCLGIKLCVNLSAAPGYLQCPFLSLLLLPQSGCIVDALYLQHEQGFA